MLQTLNVSVVKVKFSKPYLYVGIIVEIIRSKEFKAGRAWGAKDIANMNGITTRLHWTDQPYKGHVNDGEEVFVVLDGIVEMLFKENGAEKSVVLNTYIYW